MGLFEIGDKVSYFSNDNEYFGEVLSRNGNYFTIDIGGPSPVVIHYKRLTRVTKRKPRLIDYLRKQDEQDTLPKVQRVRERSKQKPKTTTSGNPTEDLGNTVGVTATTYIFNNVWFSSSGGWLHSSQPGITPSPSVEQEDIQDDDESEWDFDSDTDEWDGLPDGSEAP